MTQWLNFLCVSAPPRLKIPLAVVKTNSMVSPKKLGILLSGRGSNFEAIAESISAGRIANAEIALVISNRAEAGGIESARRRGFPALGVPSKSQASEAHAAGACTALQ